MSRLLIILCIAISPFHAANAVLQIEVKKGVEAGIPIAIVPFVHQGVAPPHNISDIVEADLVRSGRFQSLPHSDFLSRPSDHTQVQYKDWRLIKAEVLVVGEIKGVSNDQFQVQFQFFDVFKSRQLGGFRYTVRNDQVRKLAHQISDIIYEKLLGQRGAFDTRIAYVTAQRASTGVNYFLKIADSDGYNPQNVLESKEPILSPAWSPDGLRLAYVTFENRRSNVYVQRIRDGGRTKIADFKGLNSAPAWSPDGGRLAMTLSKDGNTEIYVLNLGSKQIIRLTRHHAIDTEPGWSPDGRYLVFTSDRSGKPQIYRVPAAGGQAERQTFEGKYNARASYSPDGKRLVMVTNQGGGFRIAVLYLANRALQVLTDSPLAESPSFAPNGAMILYATQYQGRGVLAGVSSDGRVQQLLKFQQGDVREPAWSPYNSRL